jgi:hypothetical protein
LIRACLKNIENVFIASCRFLSCAETAYRLSSGQAIRPEFVSGLSAPLAEMIIGACFLDRLLSGLGAALCEFPLTAPIRL